MNPTTRIKCPTGVKALSFCQNVLARRSKNTDLSGEKQKGTAISKTLHRGRKFKEERYISSNKIYTKREGTKFIIKGQCKASMKKLVRNILVMLNRKHEEVENVSCSCPAGKSDVCNHVMALLFELAEYSLKQLESILDEPACTSQLRKWGVPGELQSHKEPVMSASIQKM